MYNQSNDNSTNQIELRKIQTIHGNSTFVLVLPKHFVSILNITKGDYVKCKISNHRLIVEKADL
jgi:antitoxin component of MazEF toxin-antitoxin module